MVSHSGIFDVLETGRVTVVSFGIDGMPNHFYHPEFFEDLGELIEKHASETLAFDFTGITFIGSGLIGLLASLRKKGVEIVVYHASPHLQRAFDAMNLDWLRHEKDVAAVA